MTQLLSLLVLRVLGHLFGYFSCCGVIVDHRLSQYRTGWSAGSPDTVKRECRPNAGYGAAGLLAQRCVYIPASPYPAIQRCVNIPATALSISSLPR